MNKLIIACCCLFITALAQASTVSAPQVLFVGDNHLSSAKSALLESSAKSMGIEAIAFSSRKFSQSSALKNICDYPVVIMEAVNADAAAGMFGAFSHELERCDSKAITVGFDSMPALNKGMSEQQQKNIRTYVSNGLRKNYQNLFSYLSHEFFEGEKTYSPAIILPKVGFYHGQFPKHVTGDKKEFNIWLDKNLKKGVSSAPKVAVLFHRSAVETEQTQVLDATLAAIEKKGGQAFGIFFDGNEQHVDFVNLARGQVHSLINYRMLHEAEKTRQDFSKIGVPVIQGLIFRDGNREKFDQAQAGISAMMSPYFLMMPESAGVIDPTMVATIDAKTREQVPMLDHIDAIADRAIKQAILNTKDNKNKKLALFMWNYPSGDKNMGAAFLNVPDSIHDIAQALKKAGYQIDMKSPDTLINEVGKILRPFYSQSGLEALMAQGLSDYLPVKDYELWLNSLPKTVRDPIVKHWGEAKDSLYVRDVNGEPAFIIPQIKMGNLIVMPQPSRSEDEDKSTALYHDTSTPMNHYYLAVYLYAKKTHASDAFIHLGTHGSQEWLTGKERGLSIYDAPQLTVGNIPIVYPFVMDNVGEAMQAKRRGRAVMLSHMTPGFAEAGFYGELAELEELIEEYLTLAPGRTREVVKQNITDLSISLNVFEDVEFTLQDLTKDFDSYLNVLHDYMHDMSGEAQPLGVHTYGQTLNAPHLMTTVAQMLGSEFRVAASLFEENNDISLKSAPDVFSQKMADQNVVQLDETPGFKLLWAHLVEAQSFDVSDELASYLEQGLDFAKRIRGQQEMQNMLLGLNGQFVPVGQGGDPIRAHDAVPTGVNLLGFNPAKVPSKAAWQVGQQLVEELIAKHYDDHGEYPDKLAFSLWSLETMRHHGVLESQILAAMGVRPKWDETGFLRGTEIIPYSDLKRPRVDVVASATGLYRDAFPNVMLMIAKAIEEVAKLKEDNNSVYKNTQAVKSQLLKEGMTEDEAQYLSSVRIFSNDSGSYGSGLAGSSMASGTWEQDSKLSDLYLKRMGYAFGSDNKRWSQKVGGLYDKALSGTTAVLFSRSSNLYGMNTSDDPFQYFGGMALAIRNLDGESPEMLISNLREKGAAKSESFNRFMARELRNRSFHPRWIEEAQKEGYSGASMMLDRLNNFWGWTVMYPEGVTNAQWQEFADVYVKDKYDMNMRDFFENSNPTNLAQMIERMLEAERKEYWKTDDETLKKLVQTYLEIKQEHNVISDNEKFQKHLASAAQGFGLEVLLASASAAIQQELASEKALAQKSEMVEGQKLEQVEPKPPADIQWDRYAVALFLLLAFVAGGLAQIRRGRQR
jgi:cobaltochelatase CobN